jgi:cell division protein FtsQ
MDGRGRLAQSLNWLTPWFAPWRARLPIKTSAAARARVRAQRAQMWSATLPAPLLWLTRRAIRPILNAKLPRGLGLAASALVLLASAGYGTVQGGHVGTIVEAFKDARDSAANAAGFQIVALSLIGQHHLSREEVLANAGVTGRTSLLFLDVETARERLKANPWVAEATVLKLYPGELQIGITERLPFALWQKDGRLSVIADDGIVLEPYVSPRLNKLPLVVGRGADSRAKDFLALLDRYPDIREQVRAFILIGERRWNLRLRNGLDVRLPEDGVGTALDRLVTLDRETKLITRDIAAIDLRLPDRVTVRLSPAAAAARSDAIKKEKPAAKGGKA